MVKRGKKSNDGNNQQVVRKNYSRLEDLDGRIS